MRRSIVIESASAEKEIYLCLIKSFPQSNEKIVTLINYDPESEPKNNCSSIMNRFDFVDKLKDRLAQQSVTQTPISLIFINISNLDKLSKTFTSTTLYEAFKHLMLKLFKLKEEGQELIQWSPNLYIIMGEKRRLSTRVSKHGTFNKSLSLRLKMKITHIVSLSFRSRWMI